MPRWMRTFQPNFTKGMLNQAAWDRIDTKIYSAGARQMVNAALVSQGGFRRRPGTDILTALPGAPPVRLMGLFYNPNEQYLMVIIPTPSPGQGSSCQIYDSIAQTLVATVNLPYLATQLSQIYFISVEGVMLICHPAWWPIEIIRQFQNNFTASFYTFETSPGGVISYMPFYKFAAEPMTLTPSSVDPGTVELTTNGPYWSNLHNQIGPDGSAPRVQITVPADPVTGTETQIFEFVINSVQNNQQVSATLKGSTPLPNTNPTVLWAEQMMSPVWGYPICCGFQDQRLFFGGHPAAPGFLAGSMIGAPHNFNPGTAQDDEAILIVLSTESTNQIRAIISGLHFIVLTSQGPFFFPNSSSNPITPSNCGFRRTAGQQCNWTKPVIYDTAAIYVQRKGNHLREMVFDLYRQAYTTNAISLLSNDIIDEPTELHVIPADDNNPDTYLFCLNDDGTAAVYLGDRDQEIAGWVHWTSPGGVIESAAEVGEYFWMAVTRTLNNQAVTALERLDWTQALDACTTYTSPVPTAVWTGLSRYLNTTVSVIGDGYSMGTYTVDPVGNLILPVNYACSTLVVGFDYPYTVETLPIDGALNDGPLQGRPYTVASSVIKLINTDNVLINGMRLWPRAPYNPNQQLAPLYTGPFEIWLQDWSTAHTLTLTMANPGLCQVTAISVELAIS